MKRVVKIVACIGAIIWTTAEGLLAQPPPPPSEVPVDGGATIILAAGAAYGLKKYRDYRKSKKAR
ncbi:MAG: hypothetical protein RMM53_04600 [Bacteroidia bacterium]|nr:hypothetical protein [Bacteroidia bacterium]MDW8333477.1 hypothetical protein [Bacteroidia bacterium]